VVEAGVDLDFPLVMRAIGPLDRIVQAAGRCNREGKLQGLGTCLLFELEGSQPIRGWYRTGTSLTAAIARECSDRIDSPEIVRRYFQELYSKTSTDSRNIQVLRRALRFATVAKEFRMVADDTVSMVVRNGNKQEVDRLLEVPVTDRDSSWFRKARSYSVSVPVWEYRKYQEAGLVTQDDSGISVYEGPYDDLVGIGTGDEADPADLIA